MEDTAGQARFDQVMALVGVCFEGGLLLDLWTRSRGAVPTVVLTLSLAALASALTSVILRSLRAGRSWRASIPLGYDFAVVGVPICLLSGVADFAGRSLDLPVPSADTSISLSNLGIVLGMALLVSGPLRAAWLRPEPGRWWSDRWPAVLSLAGVFTAATLAARFSSLLANPWPDLRAAPSLAISGMLVITALMVGLFLPAIRRGILPTGSLTLAMAYNAALMTAPYGEYQLIPAAIVAGLVFDLLARGLRHLDRVWLWPVTAAAMPVVFFGLCFLTLALLGRLGWPAYLWAGALIITGAAGWAMSLIVRR